jgi:hypothetical protein
MFEVYKRVYRKLLGPASDEDLMKHFEYERRATFVSCWQRSESESWLMWKQYCQRGGGFAVQTTLRRLNHLFAARVKEYETLFLRPVVYIHHWSDDPLPQEVPVQVFYKPIWFSEEREIRLVRFRYECAYAGTVEQCAEALSRLDDHDYIPIDLASLAETIVLNPFSTDAHRKTIIDLVGSKPSELAARLRDSDIRENPVLGAGGAV